MADVIVSVRAPRGVVCVVVGWSDEHEACDAVSPTGLVCSYVKDHGGDWHVGFPETEAGMGMPLKWPKY